MTPYKSSLDNNTKERFMSTVTIGKGQGSYTAPASLLASAYTLSSGWVDVGIIIDDAISYNRVNYLTEKTDNDSTGIKYRLIGNITANPTKDYIIRELELHNDVLSFSTTGFNNLQLQVKADNVGSTAGTIDSLYYIMMNDYSEIPEIDGVYNASGDVINPATEEKQDTQETTLNAIQTAVEILDNVVSGTEAQVDIVAPLPAGTNLLGKVGIDQTTDGTTNKVVANAYNPLTTTYLPIRQDGGTNALQCMEYEHHEVHAGSHYFAVGVQQLANNNVLDFTWVMPNTTKWIHWKWKLDTESEMQWYIYEDAAITNALVNTFTPLNSDRNSLNTSGTVMKYEVQATLAAANADTDVTGATLLKTGISGIGKRVGGEDGRESELILKQNTIYCLRAVATAAGYIDFDMEWYEHTNVN